MKPLWYRLYFDSRYSELARLTGYSGLSIKDKDYQPQIEALTKKHGHKEMKEIADQIAYLDEKTSRYMLNDEARKLCFQLLGPAPEHPGVEAYEEQRKRWAQEKEPETHAVAEKKRRTRLRRGNARG
ncbi:hypothetical protein BH10PLA2_BH10PLA2_25360 [soil metagenome]